MDRAQQGLSNRAPQRGAARVSVGSSLVLVASLPLVLLVNVSLGISKSGWDDLHRATNTTTHGALGAILRPATRLAVHAGVVT